MQKVKGPELAEAMDGYVQDKEGNWIPDYDITLIDFDDGDVVQGEVVRIDRDEVLVDIGYKSEGVIPINELAVKHDVNPNDIVFVGEKIEALVLQKEDKDGRLVLSKKRAEFEKSWIKIEEQNKNGEFVEGKVIEVVKGGLIIDVGLRGFLPASLVDIRRVKDLQEFIGQKVECKIIEINRNRNNVVLSRRAVLEEEKKEQREQVLDNLEEGKRVKGIVSSIVPFGAFVDLDGIDGLIHISELSWDHIDHPSEILSVGDEIEVQVLDVNRERQRISLGYKQLFENPWALVMEKWAVGTETDATVTKLVSFGAFVSLDAETEGLIHISEFSDDHVETAEEMLSVGEIIKIKVIGIDTDKRRLSLSIKQVDAQSESKADNAEDGDSEIVEKVTLKKKAKKEVIENEVSEVIAETVAGEEKTEAKEEPKLKKKAPATKKSTIAVAEEEANVTVALAEPPVPEEKVDVANDASLESVLEAMKQERGTKN